jgi:hypothetical protein
MNYEAIILILITSLGFYIKIKYGIIIISFWLISILFNFFFTTFGMNVMLEEFPECEFFYISKKGDYNILYQYLKEFHIIQKKFKLPYTYKPFGIFYDNPSKNKNKLDKLKSVIGIIKERQDEKNHEKKEVKELKFNDEEFKKYMKTKNYKSITLSKCKGIIGEYETIISLMNSFIFIAKIFIKNINQKFFTRIYNPEWKDSNIKNARRNYNKKCGVLEIFGNKNMILFIPTVDDKYFNLYYE